MQLVATQKMTSHGALNPIQGAGWRGDCWAALQCLRRIDLQPIAVPTETH